ncbi:MAG: PQQ-binding-like beta-propeller repeat protein [Planctomycetales bacterium]|nr:PQQ-binding-like beta-propeller repeat protein [Planctomycetales bacterium]
MGLSTAIFLAILSPLTLRAEDWPGFRGPNADGVSKDERIPTEWSATKNLKWKLKLPGKGFSSPIVVGKHVIVTAWSGSGRDVKRHIVCVDRTSGDVLWQDEVEGQSDGGDSGFSYHGQASHTPVSDGERVYVLFGSSGVFAYDLSGKRLWHREVGNERRARFGTSSSPILHGDQLIVTAGCESASIRAFNKQTGEELWKAEADSLAQTYSTPRIVKGPDGREDLLLSVVFELWGMNPENGKLRWYAETKVDTAACPSILVEGGVAYVIGGRGGGRTAVKIGGKGDTSKDAVVWSESGGSYVPSPVLHNGHLYWINDSGIASVVDIKTGEQVTRKRLGGRFYSSVTLVNDKLYAVSRFDGTYVLKATPELEQIALNKLGDDSDFSGSPAISDGQLFIRSDEALYCIAAE